MAGVVGEQAQTIDAERLQDLRGDAVVAGIGGQAQGRVGIERVEAAVLQRVGANLVGKTDAAPLLAAQVDDHATVSILGNEPLRFVKLRAAIAAKRAERVAGQTLRMHADQRRLAQRAANDGKVLFPVDETAEGMDAQHAIGVGRRAGRRLPLPRPVVRSPSDARPVRRW